MIDELSIIIPSLNEEKYLPRLLKSISKQNYKGKLEVIVVDGKSSDNTVKKAEEYKKSISDLRIVATDKNIGHQRNVGAEKAKYKYLLFLDADVLLAKNCLNILRNKTVPEKFVAAALHSSDNIYFTDYFFLGIVYFLFLLAYIGKVPVTNGDFIFTSKKNHDYIKGFKEGAMLGEDTDYGVRSVRSGARYYFFFQILVYGSDRRVRKVGRIKLLLIWSKAFLHVRKHGPIYDTKKADYLFGNH